MSDATAQLFELSLGFSPDADDVAMWWPIVPAPEREEWFLIAHEPNANELQSVNVIELGKWAAQAFAGVAHGGPEATNRRRSFIAQTVTNREVGSWQLHGMGYLGRV